MELRGGGRARLIARVGWGDIVYGAAGRPRQHFSTTTLSAAFTSLPLERLSPIRRAPRRGLAVNDRAPPIAVD
eukprot:11204953-Lingulodinium_polyedra.AAC.1